MNPQTRHNGYVRPSMPEGANGFQFSDIDTGAGFPRRLRPPRALPAAADFKIENFRNPCQEGTSGTFPGGVTFHVCKRQTIFCEGEAAHSFYLLLSGVVRIYRLFEDGRRQIIGFRFPGEDFGLTLEADSVYGYSTDAVTDIEVRVIANTALESCIRSDPLMALNLLKQQDNDLSAANAQILLLGRMSARERVASFFLDLWRRAQRVGPELRDVPVPMTQADIADYIGLTVETVNRIISQLREEGTISMPARGVFRLEQPEKLNRLAAA